MADKPVSLEQCFNELTENAKSLYLDTTIPVLSKPPSPLEFYRDYVSWNRPCIIQHAFDHWPATYLWSNSYLRKKMGDECVTVAATPNMNGHGFADAVYANQYFVLPQYQRMSFGAYLDHLEFYHDHEPDTCKYALQKAYAIRKTDDEQLTEKKIDVQSKTDTDTQPETEYKNNDDDDDSYCSLCNEVLYCQLQNGCMPNEYSTLCDDIEMEIAWASAALNRKPDAVNFWMGESRSVSSLHQDPYENLYCVLAGQKLFTLYPPTDEVHLHKTPFKKAVYSLDITSKLWSIQCHPKWEAVQWIDLLHVNTNKLQKCSKLEVVLNKGEMLYLPTLYFHEVKQNVDEFGRVIAVNFWYDMNYDAKWNMLNFMKNTLRVHKQQDQQTNKSREQIVK